MQGALADEPRIGFTSELGLAVRTGEPGTMLASATATPELCVPAEGGAVLRPSVLITWADILTGSPANQFTLPQICMTVDLDVRVVAPIPVGAPIEGFGCILKSGRTITVGEATFSVDGREVARSLATFVASPRPEDTVTEAMTGVEPLAKRVVVTPTESVTAMLGSRIVAPGVVEVDRTQRILNWADTVQGGAVAATAEEAALSLPGAGVPSELSVRYLSSVRHGPMRATATAFGQWTRVEVVDAGRDEHRVAAVATCR